MESERYTGMNCGDVGDTQAHLPSADDGCFAKRLDGCHYADCDEIG